MKLNYLTPILLLLAAACSQMPKNAEKPITIKVEKKRTEEEVLSIKPEKDDYKTWIFEQPVKVRVSASHTQRLALGFILAQKPAHSVKRQCF